MSDLLPEGVNANSKRGTCLHLAASRRREDLCRIILDADFLCLNAVDRTGSTALHYAAAQRLGAVCLRILAHPDFSSVNVLDNDGQTALHIAAKGGMADVCDAILGFEGFSAGAVRTDAG